MNKLEKLIDAEPQFVLTGKIPQERDIFSSEYGVFEFLSGLSKYSVHVAKKGGECVQEYIIEAGINWCRSNGYLPTSPQNQHQKP